MPRWSGSSTSSSGRRSRPGVPRRTPRDAPPDRPGAWADRNPAVAEPAMLEPAVAELALPAVEETHEHGPTGDEAVAIEPEADSEALAAWTEALAAMRVRAGLGDDGPADSDVTAEPPSGLDPDLLEAHDAP